MEIAAADVVAVVGMVPAAAAAAVVKTIQQVELPAVREVTTTLASPVPVPAAAALADAAKTVDVAMIVANQQPVAMAAFVVAMVAETVGASATIGTRLLLLPGTFAATLQDPNFVVCLTEAAAAAGRAPGHDTALAAEHGIPTVAGHDNIHEDDIAAAAAAVAAAMLVP